MRKTAATIFILSLILSCLTGCGSVGRRQTMRLRLIDGAGTGSLILAGDQVYQIPAEDLSVYVGDRRGSPEDLCNGMMVDVEYRGNVEESTPARLPGVRSVSIPAPREELARSPEGDFYDLCTLYLKVLETLWYDDPALNDDIEYISVDLSEAPGSLTLAERSAIVWAFASRHKAVPLELSINELLDTGYIHLSDLRWTDGVLFTVSPGRSSSTMGTLSFDASKWRSGDGSVTYRDGVSDAPAEGPWESFTVQFRTES